MAKTRTHFLCNACGSLHPKWMGKCPDCGTWDALEEVREAKADERKLRIAGTAITRSVARSTDSAGVSLSWHTSGSVTPGSCGLWRVCRIRATVASRPSSVTSWPLSHRSVAHMTAI